MRRSFRMCCLSLSFSNSLSPSSAASSPESQAKSSPVVIPGNGKWKCPGHPYLPLRKLSGYFSKTLAPQAHVPTTVMERFPFWRKHRFPFFPAQVQNQDLKKQQKIKNAARKPPHATSTPHRGKKSALAPDPPNPTTWRERKQKKNQKKTPKKTTTSNQRDCRGKKWKWLSKRRFFLFVCFFVGFFFFFLLETKSQHSSPMHGDARQSTVWEKD